MFEDVLEQMETGIYVDDAELDQIFSMDEAGTYVTLRELIASREPELGAALGDVPLRNSPGVRSVQALSEDEFEPIVFAFLDSFDPNELLVVGEKSFSADQLREEVRERSPIGQRITEMVRRDSLFVEKALEQRKIRKKVGRTRKLPGFPF